MSPAGIAIKVTSLFFSLGILIVLFRKISSMKKYGITSVFYLIAVSVLLALPSLFILLTNEQNEMTMLLLAQSFIIAVGILHVIVVYTALPWYRTQSFGTQIFFILAILFFSYFLTNLSFSLQNVQFSPVWHVSLLWFMIPVLLKKTGDELVSVPEKEYKVWYYPVKNSFGEPTEEELQNPVIISLIFRKNEKGRDLTTFRVKAPVGMEFGHLFYYFINDYNDRHPEGTISYMMDNKEPCGWIFRKASRSIIRRKVVIDPENSVYGNELKENDLLYCQRIESNLKLTENETT